MLSYIMIKTQLRNGILLLKSNPRYREDIRQFIEFGVGYAIVLVLGYFLMRQINLSLTETEMGKFSFISSLVLILAPIFYISAPQAYLRFHKDHQISQKLRQFLMPFYWFSFAGLAGMIFWLTHSYIAWVYALLPFFTEKTYLLRCEMKIRQLNILRALELLVPLSLIFICCSIKKSSLNSNDILLFYGLGYAVSFFFLCRLKNEEPIEHKKVITYLIPVMFTGGLVTLLNNAGVILAKYYLGYEAAGSMGVATRSLLFIRSLTAVFLMFYPMIYFREAEKGNQKIIRIYRFVMLASVAFFTGVLVFFAPMLYRLLGASEYLNTVHLFIILAIAEIMNFGVDVFGIYFGLEIKTWKTTVIKCLSLLILACGLVFISFTRITLLKLTFVILLAAVISSVICIVWALHSERKYFNQILNKEAD